MDESGNQPPVLLIATEGEWAGRSFESVLAANGYAVLRVEDGRDAVMWVERVKPDAILLDEHLPGLGGIEVCRKLRDDPKFDAATPLFIIASTPSPRTVKSEAYRAGAWEVCSQPLDTETLLLELGTFIRAKQAVAKARAQTLVDPSTGMMTPLGMQRWAEQLAARATRNHEPLACVVLKPANASTKEHPTTAQEALLAFLSVSRDVFRRSDIVGFIDEGRLALLAPETDTQGVQGLLARLRSAINAAVQAQPEKPQESTGEFQAGYWAVEDFASAPVDPAELLRRAGEAYDQANRAAGRGFSLGFDKLPVS